MRMPIKLDFFIRAHAWKIFVLTIVPMVVALFVWSFSIDGTPHFFSTLPPWGVAVARFFIGLFCGVFFAVGNLHILEWMYALGMKLHKDDSDRAIKFKTRLRQLCIVDMVLICLWAASFGWGPYFFADFFPLVTMFNLEYALKLCIAYIVSREFIYFEREGKGVFIETMGVFFHMYVFPYGIWFFQPRMQALMKKLNQGTNQPENAA